MYEPDSISREEKYRKIDQWALSCNIRKQFSSGMLLYSRMTKDKNNTLHSSKLLEERRVNILAPLRRKIYLV